MRKGEAALDRWSWAHVGTGAALAKVRVGPWAAVLLLVGFEVLEAGLRRVSLHGSGLFEYESPRNIVADVALGVLAFLVVRAVVPLRAKHVKVPAPVPASVPADAA